MMIKDIYYKFSLNQLKTDQHYFMKSFKEIIIQDLESEISRVYSNVLNKNKKKEVILNYLYKFLF
jgi:hypothetical protein